MPQSNITIYSSNYCPFCHRAKALLKHKGLAYNEITIDGNAGQRRIMIERSGRTSVPQIFIGDKHVGGCDDLFMLESQGGL